jgi:hypothetical protein
MGDVRGVGAVFRMLQVGAGHFTYTPSEPGGTTTREIEASFMKILLEASRVEDEAGQTQVGKREGLI